MNASPIAISLGTRLILSSDAPHPGLCLSSWERSVPMGYLGLWFRVKLTLYLLDIVWTSAWGWRYWNINQFVGLLVTHLRLKRRFGERTESSFVCRQCFYVTLDAAKLNGVKCLFTPKTPRGLIPHMQTLTRGRGKACLHVFEESIAEFLCFRGSWLLFGTELIKLRGVLRVGHPNWLSRPTLRFCCLQRSSIRGVLRTDMPTRKFVASCNILGDLNRPILKPSYTWAGRIQPQMVPSSVVSGG
jgi:hypothetical protein